MDVEEGTGRRVVGGVDTHKDLHVAAIVDEQDRVLGTRCFATTRQGYRQMLAWMRSFGEVQRVGIESTGSLEPASFASSSRPGSKFWRSRRRISTIGADVARTTISMRRTPRTRPSPAGAPSRPKAVTEWSNPCVFSRLAGRQR